jgi:hypothetical protein
MDHLANAHDIAKDVKHPSILSKQTTDDLRCEENVTKKFDTSFCVVNRRDV